MSLPVKSAETQSVSVIVHVPIAGKQADANVAWALTPLRADEKFILALFLAMVKEENENRRD